MCKFGGMLNVAEQMLHDEALVRAKNYRSGEVELLEVVMAVDRSKLFAKFGLKSTFSYCVTLLGLSEDVAYNFINVGRKAEEVPELFVAVAEGLGVSKARKIVPVLNLQNANEWIQKARMTSKEQLERQVVEFAPEKAKVFDRVKPVAGNQTQLQVTVPVSTMDLLKRVQDLICEKKQAHADHPECLEKALRFYLEKNDPVKKAERAKVKELNLSRDKLKRRRPIPAQIRHAVNRRDRRTCTQCGSRRYLHFHHLLKVSEGGTDDLENLTTLCSACHQNVHHEADAVHRHRTQ